MSEELISQYIDDELDLDEKIVFVQTVHADERFADEAVALLQQEQQLRAAPTDCLARVPRSLPVPVTASRTRWWWTLGGLGMAAATAGLLLLFWHAPAPQAPLVAQRRFVLYLPEIDHASLVGTFTAWQPVAMERIGGSGYWTLTLQVPAGEHRYSILVDDGRLLADPTVSAREQDDFGGENSVIEVRATI